MRTVAVLMAFFAHCSYAQQCERIDHTNPDEREFRGRLIVLSGLSPPDQATVVDADKLKMHWYLQLEVPICDKDSDPHYLIRLQQPGKDLWQYRPLLDTDVEVVGKLGEWLAPDYDVPFLVVVSRVTSVNAP